MCNEKKKNLESNQNMTFQQIAFSLHGNVVNESNKNQKKKMVK